MASQTKVCKELLLDDVVEIAVMRDKEIAWAQPKCVRFIATNITMPPPVFVMTTKTDENLYMSETPTLDIETEVKVYGKSYAYKLNVTSLYNIGDMDAKASELDGQDVAFMLTRYDGTRQVVNPLSGTSSIKYSLSDGTDRKASLEISCQSCSPLIEVED